MRLLRKGVCGEGESIVSQKPSITITFIVGFRLARNRAPLEQASFDCMEVGG